MSADVVTLAPGLAGAAPMMRVLAQFNRQQLETAAEVLIALMDLQDGDPDAETEGLEDDFTTVLSGVDYGPGCALSDPGEVDDEPEEDDPQGECSEDEISTALASVTVWSGPGCPISDPAEDRQDWLP